MFFDVFAQDLQQYCKENNLDFNKVKTSPKCGNENMLFIQHLNDTTDGKGLNNESPAKVILSARKKPDGSIIIERQRDTDKYLSI